MYGTASPSKFNILTKLGVIPIDYHRENLAEAIRHQEPGGLDFVFDGMGGKESERGLELLRRGGKLVGYAVPTGLGSLLQGMVKIAFTNLAPNGKSVGFYGISELYARDKKPFMEDLALLFNLLTERKIKPIISAQLPLLEARKANELLESGQVCGNIVLLAPELL
jgi:NADPH:quinone reductase-like Zn-dependent oxidoreductase